MGKVDEFLLALIGIAVALGTFLLVIVLPVVTFLRVTRAVREAERANARVDALARVLQDLLRERRLEGEPATSPADAPELSEDEATAVTDTPAWEPAAASEPPGTVVAAAAVAAGTPPQPEADAPPPAGPPSPPSVQPSHAAAHAHVSARPSLEQRIGQRWLLYAGIAALVLGASYIVKLAFENDWISPATRIALSAAGGGVLVMGGLRFAAGGLGFFGYTLTGAGFAVLYVSVWAAQHLYGLVERGTAFALMTLVTVVAAWFADRRSAQPVAMTALIGGFATPLLLGGETGAYIALFSYLSLLTVGAALLARRHAWPLLTLACFTLLAFSFSAWAATAYRSDRYLVVQGFLTLWLAACVAAVAWAPAREGEAAAGRPPAADALTSGVTLIVGALAPALYHLASLANLYRHPRDLLIYFIAATLAGLLYSADGKRPWARLITWLVVWLPMVSWLMDHAARGARVTVLAVFGLHLMNEVRVLLHDRTRMASTLVLLLHLNGLGLLAALLVLLPRWDTGMMSATVAGAGVFYGVLALVMRPRHDVAPLHYFAVAAACAAGAIALRFQGAWVTAGWTMEGALVIWLGLRERRHWLRAGGWILFALGLLHGLDHMSRPASTATLPWVNAPALSLVAAAALLLWVASRYRALGGALPGGAARPIGAAVICAALTGLVVLSEQINGMFGRFAWQQAVEAGPMAAGATGLARQVTLSIAWAAYAVVLLVAGIARRYPPVRYLAILLFAITIGKVFFVDLARLDRFYLISSVVGLGLLLLVASYLYQRFVSDEPPADAGTSSTFP